MSFPLEATIDLDDSLIEPCCLPRMPSALPCSKEAMETTSADL